VTRAAVDTGALLALASSRDQYHDRAVDIEARFRLAGGRWVGTVLVLAELHGHLLRRVDPVTARRVVQALQSDRAFEWHDVPTDLVARALEVWIGRFTDQRFSLTDAVTFEVMRREKLSRAFAFDSDFVTAGFRLME
jgi:predicted nucleic acid-binding protein